MKRAGVGLALFLGAALASSSHAYMILHQGQDLAKPELYRPDAFGLMPTPGSPAEPITFVLGSSVLFPGPARQAFLSWAAVPGAATTLEDGGVVNFSGPWTTRLGAPDGYNAVEFVKEGWNLGGTVLAWTNLFSDPATGEILEADIYLNDENFYWGNLDPSRDHLNSVRYDEGSVLTHEIGHLLGLAHSQVSQSTLWDVIAQGETHKRSLHEDDREGLRYLYPATAADYPPPSLWGIRAGTCLFSPSSYSGYLMLTAGAPPGTQDFCLFGAGILAGVNAGLDRDGGPLAPNPVSGTSVVSENLVVATLDYTGLLTDAYDPALTNPGDQTGELFQGIFLNQAGNQLPKAAATVDKDRVTKGATVTLDGAGSSDPEGSPLTYQWLVADAPEGAAVTFSAPTGATTEVKLTTAGIYIFYLVVNDGIIDSLADDVIVTALPPASSGGGGGHGGCSLDPGAGPLAGSLLVLPLLFPAVIRALRTGRR